MCNLSKNQNQYLNQLKINPKLYDVYGKIINNYIIIIILYMDYNI